MPLLVVYPLLVIADIGLTYTVSPDLKFESNIIINTLNLNWNSIIVSSTLIVTLVIWFVSKANKYFGQSLDSKDATFNGAKSVNFLVIAFFYIHFLASIFVVINNYLGFVYLYSHENSALKNISISYVHFYQRDIMLFNFFIYTALIAVGVVVSILRVKRPNIGFKIYNFNRRTKMKKAIIGIFLSIVVWVLLVLIILLSKHEAITFNNVFNQTKPAIITGLALLSILLIIKIKKKVF